MITKNSLNHRYYDRACYGVFDFFIKKQIPYRLVVKWT